MRLPVCVSLFIVTIFSFPMISRGENLTPEQIENLRLRLSQVKQSLETHSHSKNQGARSAFLAASNDSRQAVKLYLDCYKKVNYDMEGRSESDFRAWQDSQEANLKSKDFLESLLVQLRYLSLSCHAAEVEKLDEVFGPLNQYVESLSNIQEIPDRMLTNDISNSVFAKAYELEKMLSNNKSWEGVPLRIGGIYDKTILPHLRANNPTSLMNAWDKRIEQEKRMVLFFESKKQEELRGMDRDAKIKERDRQETRGGVLKTYDLDDFTRETLPRLQWDRLKDMFLYINQLDAAKEMLTFVQANLTTPNGEQFYTEFVSVLDGGLKKEEPAVPAATPNP
jgi:hypothetical protein